MPNNDGETHTPGQEFQELSRAMRELVDAVAAATGLDRFVRWIDRILKRKGKDA